LEVFESGRMVKAMKIACLQVNPTVGDFSGNVGRLIRAYEAALQAGADLAVGPELALCKQTVAIYTANPF